MGVTLNTCVPLSPAWRERCTQHAYLFVSRQVMIVRVIELFSSLIQRYLVLLMHTHQKLCEASSQPAYSVPLGQQRLAQQQGRSGHAALASSPPHASHPPRWASRFWSTAGSASCPGEHQSCWWCLQLCCVPPCMQTDLCRKLAQARQGKGTAARL